MNIIMIGPLPEPITGLSIANEMLKDGLIENGHNVKIVDTNTEKEFTNLSSQGKFNFKKIVSSITPIVNASKQILFKDFDVIYITPAQSYLGFIKYTPFIIAANIKRKPVYIHFHGGFVREMYNSVNTFKKAKLKKYFDKCTGIIVLGPTLVKMFEGIISEEKIHVCENGVDESFFIRIDELEKRFLRIENSKSIEILYLSNLMKSKGILDLMEACTLLKNKGIKFHLNVAGNIEPNLVQEFEEYKKKLTNEMTYYGVVKAEEKRKLLLKSDVFCLPTYYPNEGQPISILEAMAMGCGIITTSQGGICDIFKNEVNGLECKKKNPVNLAECIIHIKNDIRKYASLNNRIALSRYTDKKFVNRIERIFVSNISETKT